MVITADSVATTDVAVEMTAYGSSYFFSAVADVVTETASANRRQTINGESKVPLTGKPPRLHGLGGFLLSFTLVFSFSLCSLPLPAL